PAALFRTLREVRDQLVELCIRLRRHAPFEPRLELVAVQTSFEVALAKDLADAVALLVADTERAVARTFAAAVPVVIRSWHVCPSDRSGQSSVSSPASSAYRARRASPRTARALAI